MCGGQGGSGGGEVTQESRQADVGHDVPADDNEGHESEVHRNCRNALMLQYAQELTYDCLWWVVGDAPSPTKDGEPHASKGSLEQPVPHKVVCCTVRDTK